jgi:hypothetical protein
MAGNRSAVPRLIIFIQNRLLQIYLTDQKCSIKPYKIKQENL